MKSLATNLPAVCCFDELNDVRNGHALHRVVVHVAARVECRLKVDAANGRVLDGKLDDLCRSHDH